MLGLLWPSKDPCEPRIRHERDDLEVNQTGTHQGQFRKCPSSFVGVFRFEHQEGFVVVGVLSLTASIG